MAEPDFTVEDMPAHIAALQDQFSGDDRADWLKVAAAALDMTSDDLDADELGHLVVATDTLVSTGRSTVWLQPEGDVGTLDPDALFLILNDRQLEVSAIVDDGICAADDLASGMVRASVWGMADQPFVLKKGERLARYCHAPASIIDKREEGWEAARDLFDSFAAARAGLYDRVEGPAETGGVSAGDGVAAVDLPGISPVLRTRIQGMSATQIVDGLREGALRPGDVVQSIIPLVSISDGIGGATSGFLESRPADGRVYKAMLFVDDDDDALNVLRARTGGSVPVALRAVGGDVADLLELILQHVPRELCDHLVVYATPRPSRRARPGSVVAKLEALRQADSIIATTRLLSPAATFVVEQDPALEYYFKGKISYVSVMDLGAVAKLPQRRRRLLVSNVPIQPDDAPGAARPSLAQAIGVSAELMQFNAYGYAKSAAQPSFKVESRPILVGASLRTAKPLSVTNMAALQGFDANDISACGTVTNCGCGSCLLSGHLVYGLRGPRCRSLAAARSSIMRL